MRVMLVRMCRVLGIRRCNRSRWARWFVARLVAGGTLRAA